MGKGDPKDGSSLRARRGGRKRGVLQGSSLTTIPTINLCCEQHGSRGKGVTLCGPRPRVEAALA
ncbi:hypothetical protein V7S43_005462 [Phytophthora oleae]|uniref:Uncharacterized protein n=1 Tax=Phytophthora oleae TaxID=2107226 RepID=A0ABD3FQB1_9STRA